MKEKVKILVYVLIPTFFYIFFGMIISLTAYAFGNELISDNAGHISMIISAFCSALFAQKLSGIKLKDRTDLRKVKILPLTAILMIGYAIDQIIQFGSGNILSRITSAPENMSANETVFSIIGAVLIAPVCEEIIFRFSSIEISKNEFSAPLMVIANGIFFALLHPYNIQGFLTTFSFGIITAIIYIYSHKLIYCIALHAFCNFMSVLVPTEKIMFGGQPIQSVVNGFGVCSYIWIIVNALILAIGIVIFGGYKRSDKVSTAEKQ